MALRLSALRVGLPFFYPQENSLYSFLLEAARIRSVEKSNDLIGNRIRDLPACSIVQCISWNFASFSACENISRSVEPEGSIPLCVSTSGLHPTFPYCNPAGIWRSLISAPSAVRLQRALTGSYFIRKQGQVFWDPKELLSPCWRTTPFTVMP
jgi:hypothetical protein